MIVREVRRQAARLARRRCRAAQPALAAVRDGERPFVVLDILHREMLEAALQAHGLDVSTLDRGMLEEWTRAWHLLDPWWDAVEGLTRLKTRFPIVTLSNGNVALMLDMARHGGLPWDAILGVEATRIYKPDAAAYLATATIFAISPGELCLVAAHHSDLAAARRAGLLTAYVDRPIERGGAAAPDREQREEWEWQSNSLIDLAVQLGC